MSLKITLQQGISSLFARPSSQRRLCCEYVGTLIRNFTYPNVYQYFISLSKNTTKTKKLWSGLIWRLHTTKRIRWRWPFLEEKNTSQRKKSTKRPQLRPIENFRANLKRKMCSKNYRPKDVKSLMTKIREELKSIETTGIRKVMKDVQAKAHKLGVTFFLQAICV
jgi:hypothetical protein